MAEDNDVDPELLADVKKVVDSLIEKGLVRVSGQNEDGENLYELTEAGATMAEAMLAVDDVEVSLN